MVTLTLLNNLDFSSTHPNFIGFCVCLVIFFNNIMRCFPTQLPVGLFLLDYHGIANLPTILQLDGYFKIAELGDAIHFTFLQEFGWAAILGNNFFYSSYGCKNAARLAFIVVFFWVASPIYSLHARHVVHMIRERV